MQILNPEGRESEWQLDNLTLLNALEILDFKPEIDLFASHINHHLTKFVLTVWLKILWPWCFRPRLVYSLLLRFTSFQWNFIRNFEQLGAKRWRIKKKLLELCKAILSAQAPNHTWNKFNNLINVIVLWCHDILYIEKKPENNANNVDIAVMDKAKKT